MKKFARYPFYALCCFFLLSSFSVIRQLVSRMGAELMKVYTWDTPIYFAVGRGLLNGIKPYSGLFETKPPGIFFLTAISLSINGDTDFCNIISFLCLFILTAAPVLLTMLLLRKKNIQFSTRLLLAVCAGMTGILLMLYTQLRSGNIQVEAYGCGFLVLYLMVIALMDTEKARPYSPSLFLAAFFVMMAVMFKEPFLLVAVASALLFIHSFRDFLYRLLLPLLYGGAMGIFLMLFTGTLIPYLTNYLPYMTGSHVSIYGSPFQRALQINLLLDNCGNFSALLQGVLLLLFAAAVFVNLSSARKETLTGGHISPGIVFRIIKFPLMLYLVSFAVGLGGQYYNHHYVFAVPFYMALLFCLLKFLSEALEKRPAAKPLEEPSAAVFDNDQKQHFRILLPDLIALLALMSCTAMFLLPDYQPDPTMLGDNDKMRTEAAYVDNMLDFLGEDHYQFLGFNGNCFYGLTEHSPLGPVFFQDPNTLQDSSDDNWFARNLRKQLKETNILIVQKVDAGAMTDYINNTIAEDFTAELPEGIPEPPSNFGYQLYFRK